MKDTKILDIMDKIERIWIYNRHLRLGQLICGVISPEYFSEIDDEKLIKLLENKYEKLQR